LVQNYTVEQAYGPFIGLERPFVTFRDAGFCINTFPITVLDIAKAIRKAKSLGHVDYRSFSVQNFQNLAKLQNGDVSWIVPGKFIAFSGPVTKRRQISPGVFTLSPEQYVPLFKNLGVTCVIRFNDKCYDRKVFLNNGIKHVDLFYEDGGNPSEAILQSFISVCEQTKGAIAVHCKAGLGRTGTNIAAYMMKHWGYTAKEATAWCR
jgi:cell division cycle 14